MSKRSALSIAMLAFLAFASVAITFVIRQKMEEHRRISSVFDAFWGRSMPNERVKVGPGDFDVVRERLAADGVEVAPGGWFSKGGDWGDPIANASVNDVAGSLDFGAVERFSWAVVADSQGVHDLGEPLKEFATVPMNLKTEGFAFRLIARWWKTEKGTAGYLDPVGRLEDTRFGVRLQSIHVDDYEPRMIIYVSLAFRGGILPSHNAMLPIKVDIP